MEQTRIFECAVIAELWESWCGKTAWSVLLRQFGELGGKIEYRCGMPQSKSAIPLTFALIKPDGSKITGNSRLKDIREGIKLLSIHTHETPNSIS